MNHRTIVLPVAMFYVVFATIVSADTFTVTNTDDTGTGSLRQAITDANNHAGLDTIAFNIPGAGVHTITPVTLLPDITGSVIIDGANGGVAANRVELSGAGALSTGLSFPSGPSDCEIRNLVINGFTSRQILFITVTNSIIQGNFLGLNTAGTGVVAGSGLGIEMCCGSSGVLIGGTTAAARNVISSTNNAAIAVSGSSATIQGNFIGLNAAGTARLGDNSTGIQIDNASATIGGVNPGERNVIASFTGIRLGGNPALGHSAGLIEGNFIGTDATGMTALNFGNGNGVDVVHATGAVIRGNVISGNLDGVTVSSSGISGASSDLTTIQGNLIGTAADGTTALGNSRKGVYVFLSPNNTIGGTDSNEGNVIAFNGEKGVDIGLSTGNSVQGNSIFSNGALGIDLDGGSVTLNDVGDADTGGNNLQNYPLISGVTISGGNVMMTGALNSVASTAFRLEFFSNTKANPSGFGEGETFLGFTNVTTDASGNVSYNVTFPVSATARAFTATATDPTGNTSEFSPAFLTRLLNISTRMKVLTEEKVLIGGFIITGAGPKRVIVRGIGPSLGAQGVPGTLEDTTLELHGAVSINNDDWRSDQEVEIIATGIPPSNNLESAIVANLDPGSYTAILAGKNNTTGVGLVEVYDLDQSAGSKLANISTRGFVDTGDNVMIGGFIAGPTDTGATNVLIRAIGPSLASVGIQDALLDPTLELHDGSGATIATNDNWRDTQQAEIEATGIPPTVDQESAILQTLAPGNYTAIVRGKNDTTGVALVEAYNLR